ncbi:hypothetical protein EDB87DRAFT_471415 [Lactarius vividus]|nr:hypothetical protein EDB87DRAFT_471415 [Lactarius vividus]
MVILLSNLLRVIIQVLGIVTEKARFTRSRRFWTRRGVLQALPESATLLSGKGTQTRRTAGLMNETLAEYWLRHGKKKGEKAGRKSDIRPKASPRHPVAPSVETSSEPVSTATKKRGRFRQKARAESGDEDVEEDTRSRKRGRKSNGISRKASPSPASSDKERASPELLEPSTIKKWVNLPSWDRHIQTIDTVERMDDGDLFIYFKLKGEKVGCKETSKVCAEKFPQELIKFYEAHLKWRQTEHESD